jgi:hypothetical protein
VSSSAGADRPRFDIAVVGLGVVGGHHITIEAQEIMRRSTQVFVLDSGYGSIDWLRELCPVVTGLDRLYEVGARRRPTYRKMAATVVAAALENPPVSFATYGHPRVFCYPTTLIQRVSHLLDLRLHMVAAVSALDMLLIDVDYDLSAHGLQTYDATDLLIRERPLQPDVACVIWQTTWIAEPLYRTGRVPADRFIELQRHLLRYYPPEHEVLAVFSRTHPALRSIIERHTVGGLADGLATGSQSGTLFIPPVRSRPATDDRLVDRLR